MFGQVNIFAIMFYSSLSQYIEFRAKYTFNERQLIGDINVIYPLGYISYIRVLKNMNRTGYTKKWKISVSPVLRDFLNDVSRNQKKVDLRTRNRQ